jgi:hypothetical protein
MLDRLTAWLDGVSLKGPVQQKAIRAPSPQEP